MTMVKQQSCLLMAMLMEVMHALSDRIATLEARLSHTEDTDSSNSGDEGFEVIGHDN